MGYAPTTNFMRGISMKVVYTGSRNLYPYMMAAIRSLLDHNDNVEKIYMLIEDDEFPFELPDICECRNVSGQTYFKPESCVNYRSIFTYFCLIRVCYAEMFPDVDRIMQLDCDTIVNDSLDEIWNIDLTDKWFAMCPEYVGGYRPFGRDQLYYNAGVAVFNLEQIRKDNIVPVLVKYLNEEHARCMDQEAWNFYGQDKAAQLPVRFNETPYTGFTDNPAIVHYCGNIHWQKDRKMFRREYLDKYLNRHQKYMIHACPKRMWYVEDFLVPSMIEQGIEKDDIIIWNDTNGWGNLKSFVESCRWVGENLDIYESTWHIQDDVVLGSNFKEMTDLPYEGLANAFCNEKFDGERTNYFGNISSNGMWFSFQCILIPNDTAKRFVDWFENKAVPEKLHWDFIKTGKCDDSIFRFYVTENEPELTALNIYPCIVDHIDYLMGGTMINHQRNKDDDSTRRAYWRSDDLDKVVAELEEKLKTYKKK